MLQSFDRKVPVWQQRLRVMLKKEVRKHGKRHATTARTKAQKEARKRKAKAKLAANKKRYDKYKAAVKSYWLGQSDQHP